MARSYISVPVRVCESSKKTLMHSWLAKWNTQQKTINQTSEVIQASDVFMTFIISHLALLANYYKPYHWL